ncbi:hypothetical protein CYMTET_22057 [Cymbomonas tetramitiformis]|uniref:Uncharacterized protein n=1 Tax=Cymbomonas tetramitiformis TaxID=36881 RepID=A0AAE0G0U2_9CHLO|nr:hypothetical protein CYMTET_22057 [Cymbomonas tetramitiformis]
MVLEISVLARNAFHGRFLKPPVYTQGGDGSSSKGEGLHAKEAIPAGITVFTETPIVSQQSLQNKLDGLLACAHCCRSLVTQEQFLQRLPNAVKQYDARRDPASNCSPTCDDLAAPLEAAARGKPAACVESGDTVEETTEPSLPRPELWPYRDPVGCHGCCELYCNRFCRAASFKAHHQRLCPGGCTADGGAEGPGSWKELEQSCACLPARLQPHSAAPLLACKLAAGLLISRAQRLADGQACGAAMELELVAGFDCHPSTEELRSPYRTKAMYATLCEAAGMTPEERAWMRLEDFEKILGRVLVNCAHIRPKSPFSGYFSQLKATFGSGIRKALMDQLFHFAAANGIERQWMPECFETACATAGYGVYQLQAKLNHDCTPNMEVHSFNFDDHTIDVVSKGGVAPVDEATVMLRQLHRHHRTEDEVQVLAVRARVSVAGPAPIPLLGTGPKTGVRERRDQPPDLQKSMHFDVQGVVHKCSALCVGCDWLAAGAREEGQARGARTVLRMGDFLVLVLAGSKGEAQDLWKHADQVTEWLRLRRMVKNTQSDPAQETNKGESCALTPHSRPAEECSVYTRRPEASLWSELRSLQLIHREMEGV